MARDAVTVNALSDSRAVTDYHLCAMPAATCNRLAVLGGAWGLLLAALPAFVMSDGFSLFLLAALSCAAAAGAAGTLLTGLLALTGYRRNAKRPAVIRWSMTGAAQGLIAGSIAAFLVWTLMSLSISGLLSGRQVSLSEMMSPSVFYGSLFTSLSVFLYTVAGGLLLGPFSGPLVNRIVERSLEEDSVS